MNLLLKDELKKKYNISFLTINISEQGNWNNIKISNWIKFIGEMDFNVDINEEISFKIILICVDHESNLFHLVSKNNFYKKESIVLRKEDFFYISISENFYKEGCSSPWLSPVITSQGDVTICCNDNHVDMKLNNIKDEDFNNIWFKDVKIKKYRYSHICGEYNNMSICQRCLGIKSNSLSSDIVSDYCSDDYQLQGLDYLYKARIERKKIFKYLYLELTDNCQLSCVYCNQKYSDWKKVHGISERGFMNIKDIISFIFRFEKHYFFENICLFWFGEPLLHPDFKNIIDILVQNRSFFSKIEIHTNAVSLNSDYIDKLSKVPFPLKIHFSIDAYKENTYLSLKNKDLLKIVNNNIKKFLKSAENNNNIQSVLQYIINKKNHSETKLFVKSWKSFFEQNNYEYQLTTYFDFKKKNIIYLRALDPLEPEEYDFYNNMFLNMRENTFHSGNEGYIDYSSEGYEKLNVCPYPFEFIMIRYDGMLTHCCHDISCECGDFNIFNNNLKDFELYMKSFYERFLNNKIEICKKCYFERSINSDKTYLEKVLRMMNLFKVNPSNLLSRDKNENN